MDVNFSDVDQAWLDHVQDGGFDDAAIARYLLAAVEAISAMVDAGERPDPQPRLVDSRVVKQYVENVRQVNARKDDYIERLKFWGKWVHAPEGTKKEHRMVRDSKGQIVGTLEIAG